MSTQPKSTGLRPLSVRNSSPPPVSSHPLTSRRNPCKTSTLSIPNSQRGDRRTHFVVVPGAVWCRRGTVSIALAYAAYAVSGADFGHHGREQAVAVGKQCKRCRRVRLWQDAHRAWKHVGSQRRQAIFGPGDGATAL